MLSNRVDLKFSFPIVFAVIHNFLLQNKDGLKYHVVVQKNHQKYLQRYQHYHVLVFDYGLGFQPLLYNEMLQQVVCIFDSAIMKRNLADTSHIEG